MEQVALGWLIFEMTDSALMVGISGAVRGLPFFLLGTLSGAIADRVDRRKFLRYLTLFGSLVSVSIAAVLLANFEQPWYIIALTLGTGCMFALSMTIMQAYIFDIVGQEHALNGLSLSMMSFRFGGLGGALLAGIVITTLGVSGLYIICSITYLAAAAVLLGTRGVDQATPTKKSPVMENIHDSITLMRYNRTLLTLMILAILVEIFGISWRSITPVIAKDVLNIGPFGLGIMTAVIHSGGVVGLILIASLGSTQKKGLTTLITLICFGLGLMSFSLSSNIVILVMLMAVVAASASAIDPLFMALVQSNVPNKQRGQAMGAWVLCLGFGPIGQVSIGFMANELGPIEALLISGSVMTLLGISSLIWVPRIRRLA